jgi:hypothetical protein
LQASRSRSLSLVQQSKTDCLDVVTMKSRKGTSTPRESDDSSGSDSFPESYDDNDMFGVCEAEGSCKSFEEVDPRADEKEVEQLARRETMDVRVWRLVVLAAMVGAAILVSTGAYMLLVNEEDNDFVESVSIYNLIDRIQKRGVD